MDFAEPPMAPRRTTWLRELIEGALKQLRAVFAGPPSPGQTFFWFLLFCALLYVRSPFSNSIFDEQEALLANPYVNGDHIGFFQVLQRDFWGLPPERSIGSYRPLPNLIWRCLWSLHDHPWLPHALNVVLHAFNATLVANLAWRWTTSSRLGWLSGACFVSFAVLTETVSGAVGLADVLSGTGLLLALTLLSRPLLVMGVGVFALSALALFSKESSIVLVVLVPWAAWLSATVHHPGKPRALWRSAVALLASAAALVLYVEVRKRLFPGPIDPSLEQALPAASPWWQKTVHAALHWFAQPRLPQDPINNPLVGVGTAERIASALRIYSSGLGQLLLPRRLSGDYSYAAELPETNSLSLVSLLGGVMLILPGLLALGLGVWAALRRRRTTQWDRATRCAVLLALGFAIVPVAYFPQSNLLVLLPTVRAERFWYLPGVGCAWLLGAAFDTLLVRRIRVRGVCLTRVLVGLFIGFQAVQARLHAFDYNSDLAFWRATARAVPNSAKAHLNYGVMTGARGDLQTRERETREAMRLAPQWPMAHVYYGDTLCRMKRFDDAWPHYLRGFELGPNESNLIALGLQCLWRNQALLQHEDELRELAAKHRGSWLHYLATDTLDNGAAQGGVDPKYRPRGYDEGPR